jgi:hypothetical protein
MSLKKASSSLVSRSRVGFTPTGGGAAVTISNVIVTDSNWNNLDDTAVGTSSSYIKIIGSGFVVNPSVYVGTTQVSSGNITFVSSTELRVILPSLSLGTQNLFVFNTDYSGAIWSAGLVVSGFPDFTQTTYTSSTPLSVSVQLVATGDAPLTYALQGGSSLPAGTTLSSSGLITGTTTDGTYQFTVIVSDAQNQSFQQQLTLTITSTDEYFNRTTLAINGDVNTFVSDASTNNFPVTINGDTKPSAFSPYNTNWSNYFDGTGDYLSATGGVTNAGTGDVCVEAWVYYTGTFSDYAFIFDSRGSSPFTDGFNISVNITNGYFYLGQDVQNLMTSIVCTKNTWFHVCVTRQSGVFRLFVNGVLGGTYTSSSNLSNTTNRIGASYANIYFWNGSISNLRAVKGSVPAAYQTSSTTVGATIFLPPTAPLTAIANTSLLTCQSNRLVDNSTNAFTITKNGDTKVSAFGPFTETDTTTGSGYFDGSGDYLTTPSNTAFYLATGDFTVEAFVYKSALGRKIIVSQTQNSAVPYHGWLFYVSASELLTWEGTNGPLIEDTTALPLNTWVHVAAVRSSGTTRLYKNGVQVASGTVSITNFAGNLTIGQFTTPVSGSEWSGYISNLRIVNGTSLYTSTFTPPTAPLTAVANTQLLTLQTRQPVNNHTFIDVSGNSNLITRNGNPTQGSFSPFSPAGWSNYFDGSGDFLTLSGTSATNFNGVDWTFECWFYKTALSGGNDSIIQSTAGTNNWIPYFGLGLNNNLTIAASINAAAYNSSQTYSLNAWNHIAMVRSGGVVKVYLNGTATSISVTSDITSTNLTFWFGKTDNSPGLGTYLYYFNGYLSNLRLVKGTAVYTSNFTPSTTPLTAIANTSLLTCQSNRFIDNSTNNFTITRNGDTKVVNFSPFAPTAAYSPVTHGGSAYFDGGSGDYLQCATGIAIPSTGTFTIECWVYITVSGVQILVSQYTNTDPNRSTFSIDSTLNFNPGGIVGSTVVPLHQWNHCAVTRDSSNTLRIFLNGKVDATSANYTSAIQQIQTRISGFANTPTYVLNNAYISGLRITNTAVYTSEFTPPTAPVSSNSNTTLNLPFNNAAIVDVSSRNVMETVGDAKIVSSTKKFGSGSLYFDGTGDYLAILNNNLLQFGTGNFTVEFWLNATNTGGTHGLVAASSTGTGYWASLIFQNSIYWQSVNGTTNLFSASYSSYYGSWTHVAFCRNNSVTKLYLNGIEVASASDTNNYNGTAGTYDVGRDLDNNGLLTGYIDDLRITRFARYTANFTPPTSTFLAQ